MNVFQITRWCALSALVAIGTMIGFSQHIVAQQPQTPRQPQQLQPPSAVQSGVEVLTRGPVHEAFAETITFDPEPGIVAPKAPPTDIEETPPNQRPEGKNLTWIPGYWAWDDERNDFLWVSGIWRSLPPGRQWVPGYWGQARQGSQWTSGYWADAAASEIDYLPEPPATVEAGPNIAAPSADDIWLPGSWIWQQNRYAWRPGYWTNGNQDWDWVPDHYVWTPSGYVFVDGYYDYSVPRRGIVFAPVFFDGGLRTQQGFSYIPSTVINPGVFVSHLFLRPGYGHYYFGDYYSANYANAGYSPWFAFQSSRRGYEPIYANQRWQNRRDGGWEQRAQANFQNLRDNENGRPPRNWAAQTALAKQGETSDRNNVAVVAPLDELAKRKDAQLRMQTVNPAEQKQFGQRGQEYRKYVQQRQQLEANAARNDKKDARDDIQDRQDQKQRQQLEAKSARAPGGDPATAAGAARKKFTRSPFVGPSADQLGKENAPPQRHQVFKPDLQVQPQPRTRGGQPAAGQGQPQNPPRVNQGNRQGASANQSPGQGANRGNNRQGATSGQQQGAGGQQRRSTNDQKQGGASGQQQGATGGQQQSGGGQKQGKPQTQSTNESKKKNKN